jgi:hypothetical protein
MFETDSEHMICKLKGMSNGESLEKLNNNRAHMSCSDRHIPCDTVSQPYAIPFDNLSFHSRIQARPESDDSGAIS